MPYVTISNIGSVGAIPDVPAHRLPPEAWTTVENVGFENGYAFRLLGETQVEGTPTVPPTYLFPSPSVVGSHWVYTNLANVYAVLGGVHTLITRTLGIYTGDIDDKWTGGWLNGVLVLNNGVNDPQQWLPIDPGQRLTILANWPVNTKARVMRVFQEFLIALDVTESGTRFPTVLRWSHPADPGQAPSTWDYSLATNISGRRSVGDTAGFLVDAIGVGNSLLVWKEDAVFRFDRVASNSIFSDRAISTRTGLMAIGCAKEFAPGQQLALTLDADVMVTDGQRMESVTTRRIRQRLETNISGDARSRCFVVTNPRTKTAYICYPRVGDTHCTEAAVWNWEDNTWAFKELTPTVDIKSGLYDESASSTTWNSDTQAWDLDVTTWNERAFVSSSARMLGAYPLVSQIREFSRGQKLGTTAYESRLERLGLAIAGVDRFGNPRVDFRKVKQVTAVAPIIVSTNPVTMRVSVGAQDTPDGPITWDGPYNFNSDTDEYVDCFIEGKYIAVRFECSDEVSWKMEGYGLNIELVGEDF